MPDSPATPEQHALVTEARIARDIGKGLKNVIPLPQPGGDFDRDMRAILDRVEQAQQADA